MTATPGDDAFRQGPSLGDLLVALRATWLPVAGFVVVAALAGFVLGTRTDTDYEATTTVAVADPGTQVGVFGAPVPGVAIAREEVQLLARSTAVRLRVAEELEQSSESLGTLETTVTEDRDDPFVELTVRAGTEARAVERANAFAEALVAEREARLGDELDTITESLRAAIDQRSEEIDQLDAAVAGAATDEAAADLAEQRRAAADARAVLRERLTQLEVEARAVSGGVRVADEAVEASADPGPQPLDLAVLGGLVAAVSATAVAYLRLSYEAARRGSGTTLQARVVDLDPAEERRASEPS